MSRILVTGASGLLGLNFALRMVEQHTVYGVVNQTGLNETPFNVLQADFGRADAVERILDATEPQIVIHCAAMANIDQCEAQPDLARRVNAEAPRILAAACARRGAHLVHLSTDAVFDGKKGNYVETDPPNPLSVYARTKLEAEQAVAEANPAATIARVNFYGWSLLGKRSLGEWFFYNLSAGKQVNGFTDVVFCPLEVNDLAEILLEMAQRGLSGLYHVVSSESLSKYDFGSRIARRFGFDEGLITPVSWQEGGLLAKRSPDLRLDTGKLRLALGRPLPDQAAGLERFYTLYQQGYPERIRRYFAGDNL